MEKTTFIANGMELSAILVAVEFEEYTQTSQHTKSILYAQNRLFYYDEYEELPQEYWDEETGDKIILPGSKAQEIEIISEYCTIPELDNLLYNE